MPIIFFSYNYIAYFYTNKLKQQQKWKKLTLGQNEMNHSEANIQIESLEINSDEIIIIGTVEDTPLVHRVDTSMRDYEKFLPDIANVESVAKDFLYELYINTI